MGIDKISVSCYNKNIYRAERGDALFQILTINIAFEIFGLFFCLICICISVLSPSGTGKHAAALDDIRNLFICDAFVMLSDAFAGIFRGKEGTAAFFVTHAANFALFSFNYMLFGLVVNLVTRMVPSESGVRFCRIAWGFVGADFLILFWNLFSEKIYFIDEYNIYHRAEWFPLSQIAGLACVAVGIFYLMRNRKSAQRRVILLFSVFAALCAAALITQIFIYGIAWLNIAVLIGLVIIFVYNQMFIAESLADKRKIIAEQNLMIEQERTQLMISQIKPHFIFNTLTSIAQLCDDSPQLAKETTIAFAKYLRGNMHSLDEPKPIPFAEELSHIKCYLQIEQVRFGEYLNVKYEIGVTDFEVPCLTVQPLIGKGQLRETAAPADLTFGYSWSFAGGTDSGQTHVYTAAASVISAEKKDGRFVTAYQAEPNTQLWCGYALRLLSMDAKNPPLILLSADGKYSDQTGETDGSTKLYLFYPDTYQYTAFDGNGTPLGFKHISDAEYTSLGVDGKRYAGYAIGMDTLQKTASGKTITVIAVDK